MGGTTANHRVGNSRSPDDPQDVTGVRGVNSSIFGSQSTKPLKIDKYWKQKNVKDSLRQMDFI
jgi:hypothetical protein